MWAPQTAFYHTRARSPKLGEKSGSKPWTTKNREKDPMKKKFLRLNSLESMESTSSNTSTKSSASMNKLDLESVDAKMPPSGKESKWFGHYQNDYHYHQQPQQWHQEHPQQNQYFGQVQQHHPQQSQYWPGYQYHHQNQVPHHQNHSQHSHYWPQYQYQVPFNLTKGQFEVWPMEAMAPGIEEMTYCSQHIHYQDPHQGHCQMFYPESGFSKCVNSFFQWGSALVATAATAVSSTLKETTTSLTSSLNPNAEVFTPSKPISCTDAKEIHTAEKSPQVPDVLQNHDNQEISSNCNNMTSLEKQKNIINGSEPVTPPNEPEIELKMVNQRKCTPWVPKGSVKVDNSANENPIEDIIDEESDDESDFEVDSVAGTSPRLRLLSICSSEDGIHFSEESPRSQQISASPKFYKTGIDKTKCSPFLKSFLAGQDDMSEEDSEDDDDDNDDDWDKESDEIQIIDIPDLEQFGFPTIPICGGGNLMIKSTKPTTDEVDNTNQLTSEESSKQINNKKKICCDERFPAASSNDSNLDQEQLMKKIKDANVKWNLYENHSISNENLNKEASANKNVAFSEPLVAGVRFEDPDMADDLRAARVDDIAQRRADQDRYNRLLGPIFKPEHRDKIRSYIEKQSVI